MHELPTWDWRALTFRAIAERADVSERTVYRHFTTEQELHDAVMRRLEEEAGVSYAGLDLDDLAGVTALVFSSLSSFAVSPTVMDDPTFATEDQLRRDTLRDAVVVEATDWTDVEREMAAALLDVLWNVPSFERLVIQWGLAADDATHRDHVGHRPHRGSDPRREAARSALMILRRRPHDPGGRRSRRGMPRGGRQRLAGNPRSIALDAGSGHREVTTFGCV